MTADGVIAFCPCDIDTDFRCPADEELECSDCRRKYWFAETEDEDDGN